MAIKMTMGRACIFRDKRGGDRVQGFLTKPGSVAFREHRRELAKISKRNVGDVSDADVIEYLARGKDETVRVILEQTL